MLNIILSIFLGGLLGIGFAIAAEMLDRRVRSASDLSQILGLPVLGELVADNQQTKKSTNKLSLFNLFNRFKKQYFDKKFTKNKESANNKSSKKVHFFAK